MEKQEINYPWEDAPDWAQYAAIDQNGEAYWLGNKPFLGIKTWQCGKYSRIVNCAIPKDFNWKLSLQKRLNT